MIDYRQNEIAIVEGLKRYLHNDIRPCELVRQNQEAKSPPYPYGSYTVTTPANAHGGTYSEAEDGTLYKQIMQTWSFTFQSDDLEESMALAMRAYDYFTAAGLMELDENGISVHRVRDITTRDNMISVQYEHRCGLDVTFGLLYTITPADPGVIETISF